MSKQTQNEGLQRILDLCDELGTLRSRMQDAAAKSDLLRRLRQQTRRKVQVLARYLERYRFHSPLADLLKGQKPDPQHFQILAVLLQACIKGASPFLEGRTILKRVSDSTYLALRGIHLLAPEGWLRTSGAVVAEEPGDPEGEELLQTRFRLAEWLVEAFCLEAAGVRRKVAREASRRKAYRNHQDYLVDLRLLHNLYLHRSERLFHRDRWNRIGAAVPTALPALDRRILAFAGLMERRLAATPKGSSFPSVHFRKESGLREEEMVVVVHLLFQEIYEGNAFVDAVDLLRLVSASEEDLIRNRNLLGERSPLVQRRILVLEDMFESRRLTSEVHLAPWVAGRVLGEETARADIGPDERLDFHLYLRNLDSARTFLEDLEAGE